MITKYDSVCIQHIPENYQDMLLIIHMLKTIRENNKPEDYDELYFIAQKGKFNVQEEHLLEYDSCAMDEVEEFWTYYAKY